MEVNNEHIALLLDDNQTNRSRASSQPSDHRMASPHWVAGSGPQSFHQWAIWRPIVGLCLTMAFIHCQPSEPYLTKYLRQDKNISEADLDSKVWPADTYAALLFLLPFGLAAEHFGCIPVVIFGLLCRQATRVLLLWGEGVGMMVLMQVTYAAATGSNAIIYAATYTAVERKHYPRATAAVFSCGHVGNVVGSGIGELLVDVGNVSLKTLFYFSWAFTTLGLAAFWMLFVRALPPKPETATCPLPAATIQDNATGSASAAARPSNTASLIFSATTTTANSNPVGTSTAGSKISARDSGSIAAIVMKGGGVRQLCKEFKTLYGSARVRAWSAWWIFGYSQYYVIGNYYQNQFQNINANAHLGAAEIGIEMSAVVGSLAPAFLKMCCCNRNKNVQNGPPDDNEVHDAGAASVAEIASIAATTAVLGTLYMLSTTLQASVTYSIIFNAGGFGLNSGLFAYASLAIADCIPSPRHLLVFTANTFAALCLSTIIVSAGSVTDLSTDGYFLAAAGQEFAVALLALLWFVFAVTSRG